MNRVWGTIRFFNVDGEMISQRRYYTHDGRFEIILKEKEAIYYHILPGWYDKMKTVVPDLPKKITRPPAVYSNKQFVN